MTGYTAQSQHPKAKGSFSGYEYVFSIYYLSRHFSTSSPKPAYIPVKRKVGKKKNGIQWLKGYFIGYTKANIFY